MFCGYVLILIEKGFFLLKLVKASGHIDVQLKVKHKVKLELRTWIEHKSV